MPAEKKSVAHNQKSPFFTVGKGISGVFFSGFSIASLFLSVVLSTLRRVDKSDARPPASIEFICIPYIPVPSVCGVFSARHRPFLMSQLLVQ
jgi:hypothetical protein